MHESSKQQEYCIPFVLQLVFASFIWFYREIAVYLRSATYAYITIKDQWHLLKLQTNTY